MRIQIIILLLCLSSALFAQWECPSKLGGNLKQFKSSNFSYGVELTLGIGYLENSLIANEMGLLGLNYTNNNHTFYFEGGMKIATQFDFDLMVSSGNGKFGLREFFYQNLSNYGTLTLGLQSIRSKDVYLVNERVLGLNYKKDFNKWGLNIYGGTVDNNFARNGTFCSMAYLYDILPYTNQPLIGKSLGQTNLVGMTLEYHPANSSSEFSDDGLGGDIETSKPVKLETIGFTMYSEFGSWIENPGLITGLYSNIEFGNDYSFKPEVLISASSDPSLIYCAKFNKAFTWSNTQRTAFEIAYYGQTYLNSGSTDKYVIYDSITGTRTIEVSKSANTFSNILAGTVLRFDTPDLPFGVVSVKHTIPSLKSAS
ncbi:MAG: hypothetical protein IPO21_04905 [Bacteroidales bacterium]|nr:hypothetical protein [Bacteroidales bacterium]